MSYIPSLSMHQIGATFEAFVETAKKAWNAIDNRVLQTPPSLCLIVYRL
jgi:hypothetical protein